MGSLAPYDFMCSVLAGERPSASLAARASDASADLWQRALMLEGCAVQLERAIRSLTLNDALPPAVQSFLRDAAAHAVRQALTMPAQITEIANVARELGIRIILLKGAARLLEGAMPGGRSISDIDLLVAPDDAGVLHRSLRERLGYESGAAAPEHHLPALSRRGALAIEVHIQLGPLPTALDARIWRDARAVDGSEVLTPSATGALLHALEHGALVHWAVRYRLRDLLDVAAAWTPDVDVDEVMHHLHAHSARAVFMTMLGGASRFAPGIPLERRGAWRTLRRVAWARHSLAAHVRNPARAKSLCIAAGVLAEVSPRALLRPAQLALFGVKQAQVAQR